jgi:cell division septum initiation protein DivIVA
VQQHPQVDIDVKAGDAAASVQSPPSYPGRPNLSGDVRAMLESGPAFSSALRGYDRLQVDNYVAWAEHELRACRRALTEVVKRLGEREAELQRAQRIAAQSPSGRELSEVSDRVATILQLAAEEADAAWAAARAEAADIVAQAHIEADLIKRRAQQLEARVAARLEDAERLHAQAVAAVDRSRVEAEQFLQQAAAERERLNAQAARDRAAAAAAAAEQLAAEEERSHRAREAAQAEAAAQLAEAQQQLESLLTQQERVRDDLASLASQVDLALDVLADQPTRDFSFAANSATAAVDETPTLVMWPTLTRVPVDAGDSSRGAMAAVR